MGSACRGHEEGDELDGDDGDDEAFARRLQEQENMYAGASYGETVHGRVIENFADSQLLGILLGGGPL